MTTLGSGKYTYTAILDWAKLAPGETFETVSAVATDSQDRVYAFQRKDPPVMVFDRDGNLLSSWGNGSFEFAHGIHIADDTIYVTDRNSSVCIMYTLDGKPIQMLGRHGIHSDTGCENPGDLVPRAAGPFNYPSELVPSPSGDLYVSDDAFGFTLSQIQTDTLPKSVVNGQTPGPGVLFPRKIGFNPGMIQRSKIRAPQVALDCRRTSTRPFYIGMTII